jgi:hypothetical protein
MRHRRPVAAYLAVLAIALQALWPLLAQAKPKSAVLVPVCTVQGVTHYIELPSNGTPVEEHAASQHDHCSFCSFGGERAALSPFLQPVISTGLEEARPPQVAVSKLRSEKSFSARPRAPPAVS